MMGLSHLDDIIFGFLFSSKYTNNRSDAKHLNSIAEHSEFIKYSLNRHD